MLSGDEDLDAMLPKKTSSRVCDRIVTITGFTTHFITGVISWYPVCSGRGVPCVCQQYVAPSVTTEFLVSPHPPTFPQNYHRVFLV